MEDHARFEIDNGKRNNLRIIGIPAEEEGKEKNI